MEQVLNFVRANQRFFKRGPDWFEKNLHVVRAFERHTLEQVEKGRDHYSARAIVDKLSLHTGTRETDGEYKIGNDNACDLARVFCVMNPQHADIWEMRRSDKDEFIAAVRALEAVA